MREFLRITLREHRVAALAAALGTALVASLTAASRAPTWRVEADLFISEPQLVHRLANPFAPPPPPGEGLNELPEQLTERKLVVALVKSEGLVDRWSASRPWPLRLKDRLQTALLGPVAEKDTLDALVAMVEKRLEVERKDHKVHVHLDWPEPEPALGMMRTLVGRLERGELTGEVSALEASARNLDDQLAAVRGEVEARARRIDDELRLAALQKRRPVTVAEQEQLRRDRLRADELLVRAEERHITAEVMRRTNKQRFLVVRAPALPREPLSAGPLRLGLVTLLSSLAAGLFAALALGLTGGRAMSGEQVVRVLAIPLLGRMRVPFPGRPERLRGAATAGAVLLFVATGLSTGLSDGDLWIAIRPLLVAGVAWAVWTQPLKWPLLALMFLAVVVDDPTDRPYFGVWRSPTWEWGHFFFTNIAWFTGFELSVMALAGVLFLRRYMGVRRPELLELDPLEGQAPRPLRVSLVVSGAAVLLCIGWGLLRGGIFREALWQFRSLLMMPLVCTLALHAFEFPKDLKKLGVVIFAGSLIKALLGSWFIYAIASPARLDPPHTTGHNDTMIFVVATLVPVLLLWERPTWRHLGLAAFWLPFAAQAMRLNDRRIAYVDIVLALALVYVLSPRHRMKRALTQLAVALIPVVLLYAGAGWNTKGGSFFRPVQKVRSIVAPVADSEEESSNVERDIENFNLLKSWERDMFVGQGFGHAFTEFLPSNDFAQSNFGHVGHNSILWLLWIGGLSGFTAILMYLGVAAFFAARTLRRTTEFRDRAALLVALGVLLTYLNQAFGDMGLVSVQFVFFVAAAIAIIGRLATRHGAWPGRAPAPRAGGVSSLI
jgi:hypothetical protein